MSAPVLIQHADTVTKIAMSGGIISSLGNWLTVNNALITIALAAGTFLIVVVAQSCKIYWGYHEHKRKGEEHRKHMGFDV